MATCILAARTFSPAETKYLFIPAFIGTTGLFVLAAVTAVMPGILLAATAGRVPGAAAAVFGIAGLIFAVLAGAKHVGRKDLAIPIVRAIALSVIAIGAIALGYFVVLPLTGFLFSTIFAVAGMFMGAIIGPIAGFWWSLWSPDERTCWDQRTGCLADDMIADLMTAFSTFVTMLAIVALLMWIYNLYRRHY